ncbi:MAG: hypothetical protein DWQ07_17305 [Chloroflexi bacterium]|nr:MAG: hypothetical protein DWQ07_17305 [Chloroflexota bacterium]MBL1195163.1 hypothetical protein [Chloroflexota bacterium]
MEAVWETLTPREQVVVGRYCAGYEEPAIAAAEGIQPATVRHHMHRAMKKFQVEKRGRFRHLLRNWDFSAFDQ